MVYFWVPSERVSEKKKKNTAASVEKNAVPRAGARCGLPKRAHPLPPSGIDNKPVSTRAVRVSQGANRRPNWLSRRPRLVCFRFCDESPQTRGRAGER